MLAARRHALILRLARERGSVQVAELVGILGVSDVTVRRDLDQLAKAGQLEKVHGGAVLPASAEPEAPARHPDPDADTDLPVIGALIPKSSYYFNRVVDGMRRVLREPEGRLLVAVSDYQSGQDLSLAMGLVDSGAQAVLLAPTDEVEWAGALGVPTVLVERRSYGPAAATTSWVRTDHETGAGLAVRHLHELGHRRIAVFARGETPTSRSVLSGFEQAAAALALPEMPRIIGTDLAGWPMWGAEQIDALAEKLRESDATALLVHSDEDALALLQNGFASRFAVPREISIVAYDDEFSALTRPALTAVSPPKESVGELAVRTLLDLVRDPAAPARHVDVSPRLIVRESTGVARSA
ncbi:substrate-binding domain-containing protein [Catenulispora pinisilvae]|uniref:substrate-binding domain-containing protein n=1 Tax=Catenulispora pinisilvae TaxID=2705253 RepID=UPI00189182C5|nr:substrate-binding domain-containing protein [Catenulispora pinisilvae]